MYVRAVYSNADINFRSIEPAGLVDPDSQTALPPGRTGWPTLCQP